MIRSVSSKGNACVRRIGDKISGVTGAPPMCCYHIHSSVAISKGVGVAISKGGGVAIRNASVYVVATERG